MPDILYSGRLAAPALQELSTTLAFQADKTRLLAEQLPAEMVNDEDRQGLIRFAWYSPEITLSRFTSGRLFQDDGELRWERFDTHFQVVYLGSEQHKSKLAEYGLTASEEFSQQTKSDKRYYLFGQILNVAQLRHSANNDRELPDNRYSIPYAEARIPRVLYYPLETEPQVKRTRVKIAAIEYTDPENGKLFTYRFQSLHAVE